MPPPAPPTIGKGRVIWWLSNIKFLSWAIYYFKESSLFLFMCINIKYYPQFLSCTFVLVKNIYSSSKEPIYTLQKLKPSLSNLILLNALNNVSRNLPFKKKFVMAFIHLTLRDQSHRQTFLTYKTSLESETSVTSFVYVPCLIWLLPSLSARRQNLAGNFELN